MNLFDVAISFCQGFVLLAVLGFGFSWLAEGKAAKVASQRCEPKRPINN